MALQVEAMSPASLVTIVNEWGEAPRLAAGEQDQPYPTVATGLESPPELERGLTVDSLTQVADRAYPVFSAPTGRERAELVTELLATAAVRPAVAVADDHPYPGWMVDEPRYALLATAALTLREHLAQQSSDRLGICAGRRCADVYIDASPTGDRRFCSVTCQTRARVAAFRSRHGHVAS